MYEELVYHLRECAKLDPSENTFAEAANAIEELQEKIGDIKREKVHKFFSEEYRRCKTPKWISVTERLPEERGNYLVVINCPRGRWDEICAFDGEKEWVSIDEYAEIATKWVTHWMPLPEPPKDDVK